MIQPIEAERMQTLCALFSAIVRLDSDFTAMELATIGRNLADDWQMEIEEQAAESQHKRKKFGS